jgi:hypothetical protein
MRLPAQGFFWSIAIMALAFASQAHALEKTTVAATGVTRVFINTPGDLFVKSGAEEKLVIEAEQKVLSQLDVAVKGNTVSIKSKGSFKTDKGITYTLTVKSFQGLKMEGSNNSHVEGFTGGDMDVELGGSGDVELKKIKADKLTVLLKSSGTVTVTGSGKAIAARIDGSGNIEAAGFQVKNADARLEGSGTIQVYADETLKAVLNGAGNIEYKGNAKVTQTVNGAGSVDRM